jgi:hypothetical protein
MRRPSCKDLQAEARVEAECPEMKTRALTKALTLKSILDLKERPFYAIAFPFGFFNSHNTP